MKNKISTVNAAELQKFHTHANQWWDLEGPLKTLHHLNPVRVSFVESFGSLQHKQILDVGCGGGILAEALAKKGAYVTGIDAESAAIETASAHAKALNLPLSYLHTSIEAYQGDPVDILTCFELLEHVDHPQIVIDHAARLLKPGGLFFLSTINRTPAAYLEAILCAEYILNLIPKQTHDYEKCIRPSELAAMLRQSGFELIKLTGLGYNPGTQRAYLRSSVRTNYIMVGRKAD